MSAGVIAVSALVLHVGTILVDQPRLAELPPRDPARPSAPRQAGRVLLLALGASDCEALRDGWLGQPVNALSSLAYVAAGAYLYIGLGRRDSSRPPASAVALALAGVGVGSVLYHGPMPRGAELLHDGSIVVLVATVGLAWRRRSFRRPPAAALAAGAAAIVANVLTRTGAPLCRPDSLLQGHAAWHVLTATAIAVWFSLDAEAATSRAGTRVPPSVPVAGRDPRSGH